ncbi:hypothetical protein P153DRAFT_15868 [Dothidotthia symphoricarpi CBS 119687]|uniref:Uncharacterized protein n=1 Tax=Dothidotthia symphoricarpi CBS 119687 TaxID=1392245 RepID=A0A6A6AE70_9PLEO|nr:uncharacterized protein P153DRAFT_15868 [Dothidotthia symphoricarpi CBS 119687]KAF2129234.1 hypothetical protein P153DRAFT_15868 [Dothidotthia symphoricarpi CBS 119687]
MCRLLVAFSKCVSTCWANPFFSFRMASRRTPFLQTLPFPAIHASSRGCAVPSSIPGRSWLESRREIFTMPGCQRNLPNP